MLVPAVASVVAHAVIAAAARRNKPRNTGAGWRLEVNLTRSAPAEPKPLTEVDPAVLASVTSISEKLEAAGH